jgi:hypothetical protein
LSYLFDGANDNLRGSFTSTYGDPVTVACFIKVTAHPLAVDSLIHFSNTNTATLNDSYLLRTSSTANAWRAASIDAAAAVGEAEVTVNIDGVWAGYVGMWTNDSSRTIYLQSITNTDTGTATITVSNTLQHLSIGENWGSAQDWAGKMAEIAIWNSTLTTQEVTDYLAGTSATAIAPANLIGYWPLSVANATQANQGLDAGGDLTVTGAVFDADHPTITIPGGPTLYVVRSAIRLN